MLLFRKKMVLFCPCCGLRFRRFVSGNFENNPHIYNANRYKTQRQDVLCPVCGSLPRHRILASWCEDHESELRTSDILYFAQERGMGRWMRRRHIPCTTADLFQEADLSIDIQDTGLGDGSFDFVVCNHVLEHVDDFRAALSELHRILRRGGSLICSFPMDPAIELVDEDPSVRTPEGRVERFGQHDHMRVFGMGADRLLADAGFSVERIDGSDYPAEILPVVGPADYDMNVLFRCVRQ